MLSASDVEIDSIVSDGIVLGNLRLEESL
jgi:hypothetical protein